MQERRTPRALQVSTVHLKHKTITNFGAICDAYCRSSLNLGFVLEILMRLLDLMRKSVEG